MLGSIYIGLSGLNAYSQGLQQVSNNVTNLNTSGFKASTVSFQNYFGRGYQGGLSLGIYGSSVGQGVGIGPSALNMSQGEMRQTDRDLDLAVDGSGFLVVTDGSAIRYIRTGSFEVDNDGYIVLTGTPYRLATLDAAGRPVNLSVDTKRTSPPETTTRIAFADNLSSSGTTYALSDLKVYDTAGREHLWTVTFDRKTSSVVDGVVTDSNSWTVKVTDSLGGTIAEQTLRFDTAGMATPESARLTATRVDSSGIQPDFSVELDFSAVSSYSSGEVSTLRADDINGHGVGTVTSISVNADGELELGYSNEQKQNLGEIAIADFRDLQALKQGSGGLFEWSGTGERTILSSKDPRVGKVVSKRLEASNVDLSKEFGDLILIQRGFQAASQIVSVSNDMIQQLFGIRGQG